MTPLPDDANTAFEIFPWNSQLETGIAIIDDQHRNLVSLLNKLGQQYVQGVSKQAIEQILTELSDYADYHFRTEETIWKASLGGDEWFSGHVDSHQLFFEEIELLRTSQLPFSQLLEELFSFLTQWLAYHILDSDKRMAKAVHAIAEGLSLVDARQRADDEMRGATAILIKTVLSMYEKLSSQAMQLMHEKHARQQAEAALDLSEQRWKFLLQGSHEGFWEWAEQDAPPLLPEQLAQSLLQQAGAEQGDIHEDDLPQLRAALSDMWQPSHDEVKISYRIVLPTGALRWMELRGKVIQRDSMAKPQRLIGTREDITERELISHIIRLGHEALFITDTKNRITAVNQAFTVLTGYTQDAVLGQSPSMLASGLHTPEFFSRMWQVLQRTGLWEGDIWNQRPDGKRYALHLFIQRHDGADGSPSHYVATGYDVTERKHYEIELQDQRKRLQTALESVHGGTWEWDLATDELICDARWWEMLGFTLHDSGTTRIQFWQSAIHPDDVSRVSMLIDELILNSDELCEVEYRMQTQSGEWIWVRSLGRVMQRDAAGSAIKVVGINIDITQQRNHQQELEYVELHDVLTGLPNRNLFLQLLKNTMLTSEDDRRLMAVIYLDIDSFADINDQYGVETGDRLIVAISQRVRDSVREHQSLARIGGDEFVLILSGFNQEEEIVSPVKRLLMHLAEPMLINGYSLECSASIGIAFYPQAHKVDADGLIRQASQALYQAKQAGKNRYAVFDPDNDSMTRRKLEQIEAIHQGLLQHQFVLYYQPKVDMHSGHVSGAEALIRWQHPQKGLLLPGYFIPVIEQHHLSVEIGNWVLESVFQQLVQWSAVGLPKGFVVSVNIGVVQLHDPSFSEFLIDLLKRYPEVSANQVELEILETGAIEDMSYVSGLILELQSYGFTCSLDDFGTGYSSLTFLKNIPARTIKIDQSFIRTLPHDPEHFMIINSILGLAKSLNRQVIAEGVESILHGELLLELGFSAAQGFAIAKPMPAAVLPDWVSTWEPPQAWKKCRALPVDKIPLLLAEIEQRTWMVTLQQYFDGQIDRPPLLDGCAAVDGIMPQMCLPQASIDDVDWQNLQSRYKQLLEEARSLVALYQQGQIDRLQFHFAGFKTADKQFIHQLRLIRRES
ncbi:bacteriohemerythrin [Nitrincola sp.]|uniref:bacteriohemerythrin n=1 Tax=Nitrincola sp. TaxID=1926584 RepID=UPI003A959B7A